MTRPLPTTSKWNETQSLTGHRAPREESGRGDEQRFQHVQSRAYKLWEDAGRPDGDAQRDHFWHEAEAQIEGEAGRPS